VAADPPERRWTTDRVEAFSDGVFAIAITLLVLEIGIPPDRFDDLWRALGDEWPSYLAYVTSFFTVGGVWMAHHRLFAEVEFVDPTLMRLNILLLMAASFLPFPTGLLAEALHASRDAERAAVVVYGATAVTIELLLAAARHHVGVERPTRRHGFRAGLYVVAIVIGILVLPRLAAVGYLLVAARAVLGSEGEGGLVRPAHR
jgi:uncharacterized membrane protein